MELLHDFFEKQSGNSPQKICLICDNTQVSYQFIEQSANQFAHWLIAKGIKTEDIVGMLIEPSVDYYIIMLGILKAGAVYLPIEPEYPTARIKYIIDDAKAVLLICSKDYVDKELTAHQKIIEYDKIKSEIDIQPKTCPKIANFSSENLCYVIYTSGTTGKPKGVAVTHRAVCNYIESALKIYGVTNEDRVYQGFSGSFDASLEEMWLAFASGATLITTASDVVRKGGALVRFFQIQQITVFSTVPTMLEIIEPPIKSLRILILGGEKCSQALIERWLSPNLKIFNTYGPTEGTIIASYFECKPNKAVNIGKPLPQVEILLLDDKLNPVAKGKTGEIYIGGAGLARGYINNPELTAEKFIYYKNDPSRRLYHTGDLGRLTEEGNIEFVGRLDDQVKIRGYRIEIEEIENVIKQLPEISQAIVILKEPSPGMKILVGYVVLHENSHISSDKIQEKLHEFLPAYMIPTLYEFLPEFPKLINGKIDKKSLPQPAIDISNMEYSYTSFLPFLENKITSIWEKTLQISPISNTANFFDDLGGHSLSAAKIISAMRLNEEMSHASIVDIYKNPTIEKLASKIHTVKRSKSLRKIEKQEFYLKPESIVEKFQYYSCAFIQAFVSLILVTLSPWHFSMIVIIGFSYSMTYSAIGWPQIIGMWIAFLFLLEPALVLFGVIIKWLLLGKIKPGKHKLWSFYYLRWWLVNQLYDLAPLDHLTGSPFINWYYKLLGAKIGKNCFLNTDQLCAFDLITVGDNSSIGADVNITGYKIEHGWLKLGTIEIGTNCYVGSNSVLGINTKMGNGSKLGEHSLLAEDSTLPEGESYLGSPCIPGDVDLFKIPESKKINSKLKNFFVTFSQYCLLMLLEFIFFLAMAPGVILIVYFCYINGEVINCIWAIPLAAILFITIMLSLIVFFKVIFRPIKKGTYSTKGFYYLKVWFIEHLVALSLGSIESLYGTIFSASWLRLLGAKVGKNTELASINFSPPDMLNIGEESFVGDAALLAPPKVYQDYIDFQPIQLGNRVFIGNGATIPSGTIIEDNCLIGCASISPAKVVIAGTSWLGSPAISLPRRSMVIDESEKKTYRPSITQKIVRGLFEILKIYLPAVFLYIILALDVITFYYFQSNYNFLTALLIFPFYDMSFILFEVMIIASLKWILVGVYRETSSPMWSMAVYTNELITALFDTVIVPFLLEPILGTPFVVLILRLFGVKIGKYVYVGTPYFSEFDLVRIEDGVNLNAECTLQTHLFEDRILKKGPIVVEKGCSVGDRTILLYSTLMQNYASLGDFSLLLKGEYLYPFSYWEGIPAKRNY